MRDLIWKKLGLRPARILLPASGVDLTRWAVVACDQYTSQPGYWQEVESIVGDAPSTLKLMLPEIYLGSPCEAEKTGDIVRNMERYLNGGVLREIGEGAVVVSRQVGGGKTRTGLLMAFDLECYDYTPGSKPLIRATEGTVPERIPPRLRLRERAEIELPHILLLLDDPGRTVIEPLAAGGEGELVYSFDLMQGGGHIEGRFFRREALDGVAGALEALSLRWAEVQHGERMLFAAGDGNHSLATAKANWEQVKKKLPQEEWEGHPARFALCELVNIHDEGIEFEPIHRVVFGAQPDFMEELTEIMLAQNPEGTAVCMRRDNPSIRRAAGIHAHALPFVSPEGEGCVFVQAPAYGLPVGTLQAALDEYTSRHEEAKVDYIHGEDVVRELAERGAVGFLLPAMPKEALFPAVMHDGALPRKTFSMGEAQEKRYYLECRKIVK